MNLKIKLTTKKKNQTTINYEVQSPINQVFKDRIREKNDRFFFTKKKYIIWTGQNWNVPARNWLEFIERAEILSEMKYIGISGHNRI
jgi:hypothetical protein